MRDIIKLWDYCSTSQLPYQYWAYSSLWDTDWRKYIFFHLPNTSDCYHGYPMDIQSQQARMLYKTTVPVKSTTVPVTHVLIQGFFFIFTIFYIVE
jgi:hypothetical protein